MKKIKELGKGGFGIVDLIEADDGNLYARKTFSENQPLTPELRENVIKRFKKEARDGSAFNALHRIRKWGQ